MSAKDVKFSVEARAKEATPYHDDVLIDQAAEALKDVGRRVALPLEGCGIDAK